MRIFFNITLILIILTTSKVFSQKTLPKREFRGVWVATLNAIDWPFSEKDSAEQQRRDFISLLNFHQKRGANAMIVQVRASADVIYPSNIEPWSLSISGKQGMPPKPFYDPLEFMIEETHKRGMEFHAWVNPFRAVTNTQYVKVCDDHISKTHPEWVLEYNTLKILNPGLPEVHQYVNSVIEELISNYDIDALHFDDYFYPYPDHGELKADRSTWRKYRVANESIRDWRRRNINTFVEGVHRLIVNKKPSLKFGVSPFGVWRNERDDYDGSPTRSGYTSYDHLYADVRLWLMNGWIDYVAPQLYQSTKHRSIPFIPTLEWWSNNSFGKHLYAGHAVYRVDRSLENGWRDKEEMPLQIVTARNMDKVEGSILYNSTSVWNNQGGIADSLKAIYPTPALIPQMPWIDGRPPQIPLEPEIFATDEGVKIQWKTPAMADDGDLPKYYVIYSTRSGKLPNIDSPHEILKILPSSQLEFIDKRTSQLEDYTYLITSLDQLQNESEAVLPQYPKDQNVILPQPYHEKVVVDLNSSALKATWQIINNIIDNENFTMTKDFN
ncbi:glycoside hydrolase family 10 protein [Flammeovirga yaeyamensis]|uniref:glycoside hydrolase family 10 protein n=1 Tax=Flammeovirga yaeyamensis TaxID=367791 RepID=UPI00146C0C1F|nr:family 10 glycosylhydrolase [Flammeovirga yaeyamensis]